MSNPETSNAVVNQNWFPEFDSSTVITTTWIVLIPWLLISIPGKHAGVAVFDGHGNGVWHRCFEHGWPSVCLNRLTYRSDSRMNKLGLSPDQVRRLVVELPKSSTDTSSDGMDFDLKTGQSLATSRRSSGNAPEFSSIGFWTNSRRWTAAGSGEDQVFRFCWYGLVINLTVLAMIWLTVACLIERRLRRHGTHLVFSMFELLIVMSMLAGLLALLRYEYNRSITENRVIQTLDDCFRNDVAIGGKRRNSLPGPVSQLLDHRSRLPYTDTPLFRPVEKLYVDIIRQKNMVKDYLQRRRFVQALNQSPCPICLAIDIHLITPDILEEITASKAITHATVDYVLYCDWTEFANAGNHVPEFRFGFPNVTRMEVTLSRNVPQMNQIKPLLALPNLEELLIHHVDADGADYLSKIRGQLPKQTTALLCSDLDRSEVPQFMAAFAEPDILRRE